MRHPIICKAIRNQQILRFSYTGNIRTVEPHAYGINQDGGERLRAYQIAGGTIDWRLFAISKISGLTSLEQTFSKPRDGYVRDDGSMYRVFCQL